MRDCTAHDPVSTASWHASLHLGFARDGRSVAALMSEGTAILARAGVMDGVPDMIPEIRVEAIFPDGTKLVTVHNPIP